MKSSACLKWMMAMTLPGLLAVGPATQNAAAPGTASVGAGSTDPGSTGAVVTAPAGGRSVQAIGQDLVNNGAQLAAAGATPQTFADASARADKGSAIIPLIHQQMALLDEYAQASKMAPEMHRSMQERDLAVLYLLHDAQITGAVDANAASSDPGQAVDGRCIQIMSQWLSAGQDMNAQATVTDQVERLTQQYPKSPELTHFIFFTLSESASSDGVAERLLNLATGMDNKLAGDLKPQAAVIVRQRKAETEARARLKSLEKKPITLTGTQVDGKPFTTDDLKGKVILVDFWASWCGPCKTELPQLKDIYQKYHDKGLEVVGVSNDFAQSDLTRFIADAQMPWPELFDSKAALARQWNPTTLNFGIRGIPTMFLIDKKGVLRTVEARSNMQELIPKLLAE